MAYNKDIHESIDELKGIPSGKAFTDLQNIYKVVEDDEADNYINGTDRKQTKGWITNGRDAASYGIVGYTHLTLSGAMTMLPSYGRGKAIIKFKLLGGTKDFLFFDYDNPTIKKLLIDSYGSVISVEEQLYRLTGDRNIARSYGNLSTSSFGQKMPEIRKMGHYLRGMVCEYWGDASDIVVYPFNFGDMITCAIAKDLKRSMSEQEIERRFVGVMGQKSRYEQDRFIDIVPYMEMLGSIDPDGSHYARIGPNETVYAPYETRRGYNIAIIDDSEWIKPKINKLFPSDSMLDKMPSNVSSDGNLTFSMNGLTWKANVLGNAEGVSNDGPIFSLKRTDQWFGWDDLQYMRDNPEWVKKNLIPLQRGVLEESFTPGMTYNEFVNGNKAIGYVCTHSWSVQGILDNGFSREWASNNDKKQRGGSFYGLGVYGSPIIGDPNYNCNMKDAGAARLSNYTDYDPDKPDGLKYGKVILKCAIVGGWNNFLIFDRNLAEKVYHQNWKIEDQIHQIFGQKDPSAEQYLIQGLKRGSVRNGGPGYFRYDAFENGSSDPRTGDPLHGIFINGPGDAEYEKWETFFRQHGIRGAIYHGGLDGYAFVCYNFTDVVPISVSYDNGKTFTTKPQTWSDKSGSYSSNGINWEMVNARLEYAGDSINKIGHLYKEVSRIPKRVECNGNVFGVVAVETKNGKFNLVRTRTWDKIFPIDMDVQPTVSSSGTLRFSYRGYSLRGTVSHEATGKPAFSFDGNEYDMSQLKEVFDYYSQLSNGGQEDSGYEEMEGGESQQEINESFFKFLDKMDGIYD